MKETTERAQDFFKWVVESQYDPPNPIDLEDSNIFWALRLYMVFEYDELERTRVANTVLNQYRTPEIKKHIESIMSEHPKKLWPEYRMKEQGDRMN